MERHDHRLYSIGRLLRVKRRLGFEPPPHEDDPTLDPSQENPIACVNCGYRQEGQVVDRCPECGLVLASCFRDTTAWSARPHGLDQWLVTASQVWHWDHRTRFRAALVPTTPASQRFARWSILLTVISLGPAFAVTNTPAGNSGYLRLIYVLLTILIGTAAAGAFMATLMFGLCWALRGVWRRRLTFVPASIHYASAWWPPVGLTTLVLAGISAADAPVDLFALFEILVLLGVFLWAFWLWASVTESQHVPNVLPRLLGVIVGFSVVANVLVLLIPGAVQGAMTGVLARGMSGTTRMSMFGTFSANPAMPQGPQTYGLIIDMIPSHDEALILKRFGQLGATFANRVALRRDECTLDTIRNTFGKLEVELRQRDKLILYINGHGSKYGSGSIRMVDGEVTSQMVGDFLVRLPTKDVLLIIDSCYGGKFITALRDQANAVVLASTDNSNLSFQSGLSRFWEKWESPECDLDDDGQVAVDEVFWHVYRDLLKSGEDVRQKAMMRSDERTWIGREIRESGSTTPQLECLGEASETQFAIKVIQPDTVSTSQPATDP